MMIKNRFIVQTKRFFAHPLYVGMLVLLILMTAVYVLLPAKEQSAAIRVGIYSEDTSELAQKAVNALLSSDSLYTFYECPSEEDLKYDITSGYAECGYMIPAGCFDAYVKGLYDNPVQLFDMPKSTLTLPINECFFSKIFSICAPYVGENALRTTSYGIEGDYKKFYEKYAGSDMVFALDPVTKDSYHFESGMYKLDVPVAQTAIVLLVLSGLIAQLMYLTDRESGKYVVLSRSEQLALKFIISSAAVLPVLAAGLVCSVIMYGIGIKLLFVFISGFASIPVSVALSGILKRSAIFVKALPIIVLISIVLSFVLTLVW
ncbi:MAG: ABC transporter permease [Lachnospiraceae bacterium]|nr:ABC transporter permease [Lachnospiraceae bacterium]